MGWLINAINEVYQILMTALSLMGVVVVTIIIPFWVVILLLIALHYGLGYDFPGWLHKQYACGLDWSLALAIAILYSFIGASVIRGIYFLYHSRGHLWWF